MGLFVKRRAILPISLLLSLFVLLPNLVFAKVIYGLDKARHFNSRQHGSYSIYAGSFRSLHSAQQLKEKIIARNHVPVRIIPTRSLYSVVVGPLASAQMVRSIGNSFPVPSSNRATKLSKTVNNRKVLTKPHLAVAQKPAKVALVPEQDSPSGTAINLRASYVPRLVRGIQGSPAKTQSIDSAAKSQSAGMESNLTVISPSESHIAASILLGGSTSSFDEHQQIFFPADAFRTDSFEIDNHDTDFAPAVGVAYEKIVDGGVSSWHFMHSYSLGVNIYYNENTPEGSVYEYSLPDFNNSTYTLEVKSYRIMVDTELAFRPLYFGVMPFIKAGIGGARNKLSFQNLPRPDIGADGGYYHLGDNGKNNFAYEIGAGIKLPVSQHFVLSAHYLYADLGDAESRVSDNQTGVVLASPLKTDVHTQSVLFGLSYLFG